MKILILGAHQGGVLRSSVGAVVTAAHTLDPHGCIHGVVFEAPDGQAAKTCATYQGIQKVFSVQAPEFRDTIAPEWVVPTLVQLVQDYDVVMTAADTFGKNIMPSVAAQLGMGQISDVTAILGSRRFERPIYAGNALEEVETQDEKIMLTVRPIAFEEAAVQAPAPVMDYPLVASPLKDAVTFLALETAATARPDLQGARVVVAGGRGVGSLENFTLIEQLADCLGAAIGASRAAVDAGFVTNDCQVGQTGKVIAPALYVGVGISGAVQHWSGMKESKVIVAINKDPDAPLCKMADLTLVADLFQAVPDLIAVLESEKR